MSLQPIPNPESHDQDTLEETLFSHCAKAIGVGDYRTARSFAYQLYDSVYANGPLSRRGSLRAISVILDTLFGLEDASLTRQLGDTRSQQQRVMP